MPPSTKTPRTRDPDRTLRPFFTYYGGKYRASSRYPKPQPGSVIVEPFAGAAGYSVRNYHPTTRVVLNDLDERVAATWTYLTRATSEEIMRLPLYDGTWETVDDLTGLCQEQRWLIGWHLNKGTVSPSKSPSRWMRDALKTGVNVGANYWGEAVRERLARQAPMIRHWEIRCGDYLDLPDEVHTPDSSETTWFVDPPYRQAGRHYRTNTVNYQQLGEWCRSRVGLTIVCENDGATWLPFKELGSIKGTAGRGRAGVSKEVIWVQNYG